MKKEILIHLLAEMVAKNIIDNKVNYFLVCNCIDDDERIYIYFGRKENNKLYFKLETTFRTLKTYELNDLINFLDKNYSYKDVYNFYNVSILEN